MTLGEILRDLIADNDISQKYLAKSLNIGVTTLGNYVRDIREPSFSTLIMLADFFGVSVDYLLDHRAGKAISHNEDVMLRIFRSLSLDQQVLFIEQGKLLVEQSYKIGKFSDLLTADAEVQYEQPKELLNNKSENLP